MTSTASTGAAPFAGLGQLTRLVARRDRVRVLCWVVGIVGLLVVSAESINGLYRTPAEFLQYGTLVKDNAALIVQSGPGYGLDQPTLGSVMMNETGIWTIIAVALMSVFMMVRHTRAEEESERAELIRSAPVGRHAQLAAALAGTLAANAVVDVSIVVAFVARDLPLTGSVAFACALFGAGAVFAAIAAIAAQVTAGARSAIGLATALIAVSFVLRAIGDVGDGRLSWLSPIGWAQAIRAFADERWWVLVLPIVAAAGGMALAVSLQMRRDLGAGLVGQRPGRATALPGFTSPLALATRLHRPAVIGWTVGVALLGFFYGIVADQAESILENNPEMADFLAMLGTGSITDAFLATSMLMMGLVATGYTVSAVLRLRTEETAGRADLILTTPASRRAWMSSHLLLACGGTTVVMSVTGAAMGVGLASVTGDLWQIPRLLGAALAMVPALMVVAGLAAVLYGLLPKWAPLAWGIVAFVVVVGLLQGILDLPQWVLDLSPFEHVPAIPAAPFEPMPIVLLLATAGALIGGGMAALQRRDIG
ncbi:MAG TPA: hypothetical protein PLQ10_07150 [Ilumatobacteraceae bacterium]|nr:hypothetical protein [Ilumatobacteraceae bacterium]